MIFYRELFYFTQIWELLIIYFFKCTDWVIGSIWPTVNFEDSSFKPHYLRCIYTLNVYLDCYVIIAAAWHHKQLLPLSNLIYIFGRKIHAWIFSHWPLVSSWKTFVSDYLFGLHRLDHKSFTRRDFQENLPHYVRLFNVSFTNRQLNIFFFDMHYIFFCSRAWQIGSSDRNEDCTFTILTTTTTTRNAFIEEWSCFPATSAVNMDDEFILQHF